MSSDLRACFSRASGRKKNQSDRMAQAILATCYEKSVLNEEKKNYEGALATLARWASALAQAKCRAPQ